MTIRRKSLGGGLYAVRRETNHTEDDTTITRVERLGKVKKMGHRWYAIITKQRPVMRDSFHEAVHDLEESHSEKFSMA